jgi:cobalt/nickel transport system ATP-binding protein
VVGRVGGVPVTAVIAAHALSVARGARAVLHDIGFELAPGERLLIDGDSGAGKSTLLHALLGFVPRTQGRIALFGRDCVTEHDFAPMRGPVGLLFQDPDDQLLGPSVFEDVEFGPLNLGVEPHEAHQRAHAVLARVGIEPLSARPVHELSGGQKRLAALAGVLAMQPRVLLLDEPTAGLDEGAAVRVLDALMATALPMIIASHDPLCRTRLASRSLQLRDGRLQPAVLR